MSRQIFLSLVSLILTFLLTACSQEQSLAGATSAPVEAATEPARSTPTLVQASPVASPTPQATPTPLPVTATPEQSPDPTVSTGALACKPATAGTEPAYQDPEVCLPERVEDLLARMTLAEKIGQMAQAEKRSIKNAEITEMFIGSILSGGGGTPRPNSPETWLDMVNEYQAYALKTRLGIPLIYGVDAVHGHNNVVGAVIFPHNVGLGATRDIDLVARIGRVTAEEMAATGIYWNFGPVVAVPQDIRWGRTYEGYSEDTELVTTLATAYIQGLQNIEGGPQLSHPLTVLATPKHFVGDGGTAWGSSTMEDYKIDQGVTMVDEATLRAIHLPPYIAAIDDGALAIMVSFSSWNETKMHANSYLLTEVLKGELGFEGFLISDWEGINQLPGDYYSDVVASVNAGIDMVMAPFDYADFIAHLTEAVDRGDVSMARIDDAVRRILTVKFQLGLFERATTDRSLLETVGSQAHREVAREAVRKSLVLLKNDNQTLPVSKETPLILVAGKGADDIGIQSGGWTIEWQGREGDITPGTTLLEAIEDTVTADTRVEYSPTADFNEVVAEAGPAEMGIVVVGERPYTEGVGDQADLSLSAEDIRLIEKMRASSQKVVVILFSGRPMIITDQLAQVDAFVAAWLPGTEGQGLADVIFGDYPFTGKLPYTWPRSMEQLPFDFEALETSGCEAPLFPFGYGLDVTDTSTLTIPDCSTGGQ